MIVLGVNVKGSVLRARVKYVEDRGPEACAQLISGGKVIEANERCRVLGDKECELELRWR